MTQNPISGRLVSIEVKNQVVKLCRMKKKTIGTTNGLFYWDRYIYMQLVVFCNVKLFRLWWHILGKQISTLRNVVPVKENLSSALGDFATVLIKHLKVSSFSLNRLMVQLDERICNTACKSSWRGNQYTRGQITIWVVIS